MASYSPAQFMALVQTLGTTIQSLQSQLEWFQKQMFGTKSERLRVLENAQQLALGEVLVSPPQAAPSKERFVAAHTRREPQRDAAVGEADSVPFFDEARVPVETIEVPDPQVAGLSPDQYKVISQKVSYRLAQRPGSYVILKYLRSVTKQVDTQVISCAPAPAGVLDGTRADVSFLAGLLVDKFSYYLPLYRQHQRLEHSGIEVSRPWLTQLTQQSISLLEPIYEAQFDSIRASRVKAMDETPIKAGRKERGKMRIGYFWPVYGGHDEVCFPFFPSREAQNVHKILGVEHAPGSVIVTERNKVALDVLKHTLDSGKRHISIFYGAAHMPDMSQRLRDMGFTPVSTEWETAWDLTIRSDQPSAAERFLKELLHALDE